MNYIRLSDCSSFRSERTNNISIETYISTDNMVSNCRGIVAPDSLPEVKSVCKYCKNDILLSNIRPYFKKIWFSNRDGGCSNDVLVIKTRECILPKFLYYVLCDQNFFNYDSVTSKGTKMPRGTPSAIMKYLVPDIDIETQKKIVNILEKYDDLIEINNKRIDIIDNEIEEIYKEWFIRYRFPGNINDRNICPQDWKTVRLGDVAEISTGKCNRDDAEEDGIYPLFDRSQEIKKSNMYIKDCEAIIVPGEGTDFMPRYYKGKFNLHQRCYCIEPKDDNLGKYLYSVIYMNRRYFLNVATGATVPSLRLNNFTSMKFVMPSKSLCFKFNEIASKNIILKEQLQEINENLIHQRDFLLPRLISGKLKVD